MLINPKYIGFSLVPHQKKISEFANKLNIRGNDTFYKMTAKAVEYVHNGENSSVMGKIGGGDQMNKWSDRNQTKMYYWCKDKVWVKSDKSNKRPKGTRASDFLKRCTDLNLEQDKTDIGFWLAYKDMNIKSLVLSR